MNNRRRIKRWGEDGWTLEGYAEFHHIDLAALQARVSQRADNSVEIDGVVYFKHTYLDKHLRTLL